MLNGSKRWDREGGGRRSSYSEGSEELEDIVQGLEELAAVNIDKYQATGRGVRLERIRGFQELIMSAVGGAEEAQERVIRVLDSVFENPNTIGSSDILKALAEFLEDFDRKKGGELGLNSSNSNFVDELASIIINFVTTHTDAYASGPLWKVFVRHAGEHTVLGEIATRAVGEISKEISKKERSALDFEPTQWGDLVKRLVTSMRIGYAAWIVEKYRRGKKIVTGGLGCFSSLFRKGTWRIVLWLTRGLDMLSKQNRASEEQIVMHMLEKFDDKLRRCYSSLHTSRRFIEWFLRMFVTNPDSMVYTVFLLYMDRSLQELIQEVKRYIDDPEFLEEFYKMVADSSTSLGMLWELGGKYEKNRSCPGGVCEI